MSNFSDLLPDADGLSNYWNANRDYIESLLNEINTEVYLGKGEIINNHKTPSVDSLSKPNFALNFWWGHEYDIYICPVQENILRTIAAAYTKDPYNEIPYDVRFDAPIDDVVQSLRNAIIWLKERGMEKALQSNAVRVRYEDLVLHIDGRNQKLEDVFDFPHANFNSMPDSEVKVRYLELYDEDTIKIIKELSNLGHRFKKINNITIEVIGSDKTLGQ